MKSWWPVPALVFALGLSGNALPQTLGMPIGITGKIQLISYPSIKKELKVTKDQDKQIQSMLTSLQASGAAGFSSFNPVYISKEIDTKLDELLTDVQRARLKELWYQANGFFMLRLPGPAEEIHLEAEAAAKVIAICEAHDEEVTELMMQSQRNGSKLKGMLEAKRKEYQSKVEALLNEDQKKAWTGLLGKPFKFPF